MNHLKYLIKTASTPLLTGVSPAKTVPIDAPPPGAAGGGGGGAGKAIADAFAAAGVKPDDGHRFKHLRPYNSALLSRTLLGGLIGAGTGAVGGYLGASPEEREDNPIGSIGRGALFGGLTGAGGGAASEYLWRLQRPHSIAAANKKLRADMPKHVPGSPIDQKMLRIADRNDVISKMTDEVNARQLLQRMISGGAVAGAGAGVGYASQRQYENYRKNKEESKAKAKETPEKAEPKKETPEQENK